MPDIKPGYLLRITTSANNGNEVMTHDLAGLEEHHVRFFIAVAREFRAGNGDRAVGLGDTFVDASLLDQDLAEFVTQYRKTQGLVPNEWNKELDVHKTRVLGLDFYFDLILEFIGTWHEGVYWRTYEYHEVYLVPSMIKDVSDQF